MGGGGVAKVVTIVVGWIAVEGWWWLSDSLGSSLTVSRLFGFGYRHSVGITLEFLEH